MTRELIPDSDDQDEQYVLIPPNRLAALVDQMQRNWDHDNHAANEVLVVRIREHIRQQQAPPTG
ncbi:MAG: hypothetical protein ACRDRT_06005 [Pseudonocardiaceae bacterium]